LLRRLRLGLGFAGLWLLPALTAGAARAQTPLLAPVDLRCDAMTAPLGIDDARPQLSWRLQDSRFGARQTAYRIRIATAEALLQAGSADVWDSGRIASDRSVGVVYDGPPLQPERRYFWRVEVWDKEGAAYPASPIAWFETGLLRPENWRAQWIGYEETELRRIRESGALWIMDRGEQSAAGAQRAVSGPSRHEFLLHVRLSGAVRFAHLYVTGEDTAAAWLNGRQVLPAQPMPPWGHLPWKSYRERDVTAALQQGDNALAVEVTRYTPGAGGGYKGPNPGRTPMSACLYIEMSDGKTVLRVSGEDWKAALNAGAGWRQPGFDDSAWQSAARYAPIDPEESADVGNPWPTGPVVMLRKSFQAQGPVRSARLYATALGAYRFWINGLPAGDQVLAPGWTDYRVRVVYQAYDVTAAIHAGANAIGAYLAPGWYTTPLMWQGQPYNYGNTPPALKAQLRIEHEDGSVEWIATDPTWRASVSPILKAEIYNGEIYDSGREQPGWNTTSFSDAAWRPAETVHPLEPEIVAQSFQPVRVERTLRALTLSSPKPGVYIYDFGQNMAGVARLRMQQPAGTRVRLRYAEVLNPDGTIYTANLRTAKATDEYVFSDQGKDKFEPLTDQGKDEFEPLFTFHGFRYVELTGLKEKPGLEDVTAVVFHTDAPFSGQLRTGSPMINQLWSNILWGQRSNFIGVPTDCPQRDERLGWTADAQVFWRTASYNMDLTQFSKKYAADIRGTQYRTAMYGIFAPGTAERNPGYAAGWSDAGVIIPWTSWMQTGDARILEENWEAMTGYLAAIAAESPDFLWKKSGTAFGDWLAPEGRTNQTLVATAYWAYDVSLMRQMAHALGKTGEEEAYGALFEKIKAAFIAAFVRPDGFVAGADNGPSPFGRIDNPGATSSGGDTQTGYVLALHMKLLPDSLRQAASDRLAAKIEANGGRLGTGFLGTPYLLSTLSGAGHADLAYRLLLNTQYPSWGYLVEHGATTMWERWNGDQMRGDPSMNSYNHYAYGAVADWIYRYAAGVDTAPGDPGFHTLWLHPTFDARLGSLDYTYESPYGRVRSAWSVQGATAKWSVTVPANSSAELRLTEEQQRDYLLDGAPLDASGKLRSSPGGAGERIFELPAGAYSFTVNLAP
jgi:alpha-L-rhamnosidase